MSFSVAVSVALYSMQCITMGAYINSWYNYVIARVCKVLHNGNGKLQLTYRKQVMNGGR